MSLFKQSHVSLSAMSLFHQSMEVYMQYFAHIADAHFDCSPTDIQEELKAVNMVRVINEGCLFCLRHNKFCPYDQNFVWHPTVTK